MSLKRKPTKRILTNNSTWKLTEQDKQLIVSWYAAGYTLSECAEKAQDEANISISTVQIHKYTQQLKWQALIKKIREETMHDLASVAGSHKKVRLQRHEKIYDKALKKGDLKHAIAATESQRKEMEEGSVNFTLNQFNILSDEELSQKYQEVLAKIKRLSNPQGDQSESTAKAITARHEVIENVQ